MSRHIKRLRHLSTSDMEGIALIGVGCGYQFSPWFMIGVGAALLLFFLHGSD